MDKTLIIKNSSTVELLHFLSAHGLYSFIKLLPLISGKSRAVVKENLTNASRELDFSKYFSANVLSILAQAKEENAEIVLATGAMEVTARRVLRNYPIRIDHYLTSTKEFRNKGVHKLKLIQHWSGNTPQDSFIYIGDAYIDLVIMKHAAKSYFVGHKAVYLIGKYIKRIQNISYCPNRRIP